MEKPPFASGQPLRPEEQKPKSLDDVLDTLGNKISADAAKERRKQSLRTTAQIESWRAAQDMKIDEEKAADE